MRLRSVGAQAASRHSATKVGSASRGTSRSGSPLGKAPGTRTNAWSMYDLLAITLLVLIVALVCVLPIACIRDLFFNDK
jgi:hypothetical protein